MTGRGEGSPSSSAKATADRSGGGLLAVSRPRTPGTYLNMHRKSWNNCSSKIHPDYMPLLPAGGTGPSFAFGERISYVIGSGTDFWCTLRPRLPRERS